MDYHEGCDVHCRSSRSIRPAAEAAKKAEATIIVAGLGLEVEREELDRNDLLLPGFQTELINRVAEASAGPVVLVIMAGGCVDVSFAQNNPKIGAILWAGYPGQEGGQAIADVIFGRHNPGISVSVCVMTSFIQFKLHAIWFYRRKTAIDMVQE